MNARSYRILGSTRTPYSGNRAFPFAVVYDAPSYGLGFAAHVFCGAHRTRRAAQQHIAELSKEATR